MILLIVDDEKLTREGIKCQLSANSPEIREILLADDGQNGLETARRCKPDIILTDVRMPRMSGVEMAEQILKELPDTVFLFMSAYSDREYLKAAIRLKAAAYLDKPLNLEELSQAVSSAARQRMEALTVKNAVRIERRDQRSQLALMLMNSETAVSPEAIQLGSRLELPLTDTCCFAALILNSKTSLSLLPYREMNALSLRMIRYLKERNVGVVSRTLSDQYLILFLYSAQRMEEALPLDAARLMAEDIEPLTPFLLSVGTIVFGMKNACFSYQNALELFQISFFREEAKILTKQEDRLPSTPPADMLLAFSVALSEQRRESALETAETLALSLKNSCSLTPGQVKDLYLKYLVKLDEISLSNHISLWQREGLDSESIWDSVSECSNLRELDRLLRDKIHLCFERLSENRDEHPVIFQIKEYLHQNYAVPTLSVPDVSRHVRLSSNYVCTLFKNETGQTLNQYLTDYRIKMSKQFLSDPRYKIADISSKVGYSDGNYYSKTFRKIAGLSPSEYREKML